MRLDFRQGKTMHYTHFFEKLDADTYVFNFNPRSGQIYVRRQRDGSFASRDPISLIEFGLIDYILHLEGELDA